MDRIGLYSILILISFSNLLLAQENKNPNSFGIGVTIEKEYGIEFDGIIYPTVTVSNIHLPIVVTNGLRLEPELGFWRYSISKTENDKAFINFHLGLGLFYFRTKSKISYYLGPRFCVNHTSTTSDIYEKQGHTCKLDYIIGVAVGGEYFFSNYFSLGGEVQLNHISFGHFLDELDHKQRFLANKTLIILRFYL